MRKQTVLVVTAGGFDEYAQVIRSGGHEVMPMTFRTFDAQMRICGEEFKRGIPVAVIHGVSTSRLTDDRQRPYGMSDADVITERLKKECYNIKVIVMSAVIGEPVCEHDRPYDASIPYHRGDLRDMVEVFLGLQEW